jgi:hypothetical protein
MQCHNRRVEIKRTFRRQVGRHHRHGQFFRCYPRYPNFVIDTISSSRTKTCLKRVLDAYQDTVLNLLQMHSFPGISPENFKAFKMTHALSAYTCRFSGCVWATVGYKSDQLRCEHEQKHTQKLRCAVPDCRYDIPFTSAKALKNHHNKHHAPPSSSKMARTMGLKDSCQACRSAKMLCDRIRPRCEYQVPLIRKQ